MSPETITSDDGTTSASTGKVRMDIRKLTVPNRNIDLLITNLSKLKAMPN
jgi:hypothetical protein